jgi:O-antigen/teichoic acid export membrane protein
MTLDAETTTTTTPSAPAAAVAPLWGGDGHDAQRQVRRARVVRAAALGVGGRAVNILVQVLTLGVAVRYLGRERYGMWATVSTLVAWFSMANLGLGQGLITRLSAAVGRGDDGAARRYVNSALAIIALTSGVLLLAVVSAGAFVPWARVFNVTGAQAVAEAAPVVLVASVLTICCLPLAVAGSVLAGHQRMDVVNLIALVTSALGLFALLLAVYCRASMPVLAAALLTGPLTAGLAQFAWGVRRGLIRLDRRAVNWSDAWSLLSLGFRFLFMQVASIVVFEAGAIIIAQRFGAGEVTPYAVTTRMVMIVISFLTAILSPLWPAYGEAFHRGDGEWVRRTFVRSLKLVVMTWVPAAVALSLFGQWVIKVWAGPAAVPDRLLLTSMLLFTLAQALGLTVSYLLNGVGRLKSQIVGGGLMALLHVPLALFLAGRVGVASVALSQTLLMFTIALPLAFAETWGVLREARRNSGVPAGSPG